jgi:hypothetical protein
VAQGGFVPRWEMNFFSNPAIEKKRIAFVTPA